MVVFVIQENTPSGSSTEQVKVASSPGQTQRLSGVSDLVAAAEAVYEKIWKKSTKWREMLLCVHAVMVKVMIDKQQN